MHVHHDYNKKKKIHINGAPILRVTMATVNNRKSADFCLTQMCTYDGFSHVVVENTTAGVKERDVAWEIFTN